MEHIPLIQAWTHTRSTYATDRHGHTQGAHTTPQRKNTQNTRIERDTYAHAHICTYAHTQKYTNTQIHKYKNTQIHKYTNTQIHSTWKDKEFTRSIWTPQRTAYTDWYHTQIQGRKKYTAHLVAWTVLTTLLLGSVVHHVNQRQQHLQHAVTPSVCVCVRCAPTGECKDRCSSVQSQPFVCCSQCMHKQSQVPFSCREYGQVNIGSQPKTKLFETCPTHLPSIPGTRPDTD
jgi:hypothetical protein